MKATKIGTWSSLFIVANKNINATTCFAGRQKKTQTQSINTINQQYNQNDNHGKENIRKENNG